MYQNWLLLTLVSGLSSVGFNFVNRYVLRDGRDSTAYSWWFEFFRFVIFSPFALRYLTELANMQNLVYFIAVGVVEFFSVYFYMKMHSHSELSISTVIIQLRLVWVAILAFLLLGETLEMVEYGGIALIILGQVVTAFRGGFTIGRGVANAVMASFFVAANNIVIKAASGVLSLPLVIVAMSIPTLLIFPIRMKNSRIRIIELGRTKWLKILLASVFNAVTMVFLILALKVGGVGKVSALFQSVMILQVFLGVKLLRENTQILRKVVGCLIVVVGIFLLV